MKDSHYRISLDIHSTQSQVSLPVKQGDTSRKVLISLCEGGKPYHIEDDCFAVFSARKPDKTVIENNCIIADNVIEYGFTEQTTAASGKVDIEIKLYGGDSGLITSPRFTAIVDPRAVRDEEIVSTISESEYLALSSLYTITNNAADNANGKAKLAEEKANYAQEQGDYAKEQGDYAGTEASKANTATKDANKATASANEAAELAKTKATEAANAASEASFQASRAQEEAALANTAAALANTNADLANNATTNANTARDDANAAASNATTAANNANTKAELAVTATDNANKATASAVSATNDANEAAFNANSKADLANDAATSANLAAKSIHNANLNNALKGSASGNSLRIDDVSPIEHTVRCKVSGKNLVAYPFPETTLTRHGITYTDNGDGSITANGTATENSHFIFKGKSNLPVGKYAFSGCPTGGSASTYYMTVNGFYGIKSDIGSSGSFEVKNDSPQTNFVIIVMAGTTVSNLVFKPQVEKGDTATEYAHYVDPTTVTVSRCGKNLLPFYSDLATKTVNGVTFTVNADKSVTCNGTATDNAVFRLTTDFRLPLGVYTLLGCPTNGSENARLQTNKLIDGVAKTGAIDIGSGGVLLVDDEYYVYTYIVVVSGQTVSNMTFKPMLQFGEGTDVLYESTINDTYTPNPDGTVEGVTSLYPTTTLLTDTDGVVIDVEYNRDANKVVEELLSIIRRYAERIEYVDLLASKWQGEESPYTQVVSIAGTNQFSKIQVEPSLEQLEIFRQKDITFVGENDDGVIKVNCVGQKPSADYRMQISIKEVIFNG